MANGGSSGTQATFTLAVTGLMTALPMWAPMIPVHYQPILSGVIAIIASIYHLNQPAPGQPTGTTVAVITDTATSPNTPQPPVVQVQAPSPPPGS